MLRQKLEELRREHSNLDAALTRLQSEQPFDQIQIQRLKKRKLAVKDLITKINNQLIPDIIA